MGAAALPLALAWRDAIWRALGLGSRMGHAGQLGGLLTASFVAVWSVGFAAAAIVLERGRDQPAGDLRS